MEQHRSEFGGAAEIARPAISEAIPTARAVLLPRVVARPLTAQAMTPDLQYARFSSRALAAIIDLFILNFTLAIIQMPLVGLVMSRLNTATILLATLAPIIIGGALTLFYSVWLESSSWQATLGKKLLGLRVTDLQGSRITFWKSTSRNFGKTFSSLILGVGYLMPLWSPKRQTLHDRMARCLVIRAPKN